METNRIIRLPRKLKKKLKKFAGQGTLNGIMEGFLYIDRCNKGKDSGTIILQTKYFIDCYVNHSIRFYNGGIFHPYIKFPKIKYPFNVNNLRYAKIQRLKKSYEKI